jgi:carboxyl-terminal processing protease
MERRVFKFFYMTNNKKLQVWLPLLFSITLIAGMFIGYKMRDGIPGKSFFYTEKRRPIQEVMDLIQRKYVDDVNLNMIADSGIQAMLLQLDPHSAFIPASDVDRVNEDINGSFFGIGIEFNLIQDTLHVVSVLKDGPSFAAGLKTGDKILKAGDSAISGTKVDTERIRKLLRGPLGSDVNLTLLRDSKKMSFAVKRGVIPLVSLDAAYMIDKTIGYIRLNRFSTKTYREFMISLESLKKQGLQKLILDLRDNGGGVLEEAVEIADEFLSGDKLITYTEGKHTAKKEYRCRREGQFEKGELVILANEGTASASEILLGALQDWDRATIVGRRSFGKGLVQDQYTLSDNSALRLTIARYYTPAGRSIQRPYTKGKNAYYNEVYNRYTDGEMVSADSVKNDTTKIFKTLVTGKKVFGGGGISPDYFVAADTSKMGLVTAKLYSKSILTDYGYRYYLLHPTLQETYKTTEEFVKSFSITPESWQLLESMAAKDSISLSGISEKERTYLANSLKMSVARQLYRSEGYFETMNVEDANVKKAIEILIKN